MSTLTRWRKKPIVIDAVQWTGDNIDEIWEMFGAGSVYGPTEKNPDWLIISTLEGEMRADRGDWIIRGVKGELYPYKPDIFESTYEPDTWPDNSPIAGNVEIRTITPPRLRNQLNRGNNDPYYVHPQKIKVGCAVSCHGCEGCSGDSTEDKG